MEEGKADDAVGSGSGATIDSNLSWKYHINHVALKIGKTIGTIARLRSYAATSTLLNIYRCF